MPNRYHALPHLVNLEAASPFRLPPVSTPLKKELFQGGATRKGFFLNKMNIDEHD
jgi:hypothetical protein